jgi:hypothetical protein
VYYIFYFYTGANNLYPKTNYNLANVRLQETINEHLATRSKGDVARDYMDVYSDEMEEQFKTNGSNSTFSSNTKLFCLYCNSIPAQFYSQCSHLTSHSIEKQLISSIQDLFLAGSHTSSSAIGLLKI